MGMVFGEVTFDERGPTVDALAAKITELCGLPVSIQPPHPGSLDIYDQHAYLSFAASPEEQLEVFSYRPGAAKKFYNDFMEGFEHLPTAKYAVGLNEAPGTQVFYLRSFIGYETTLLTVTLVALEALGGRPRHSLSDEDRREFGMKITEEQLAERRRQLHAQLKRAAWLQMLLLPITIPLALLSLFLMIALVPWKIWKAWGMYRKFEVDQEHRQFMLSLPERLEFLETEVNEHPALDRAALQSYTEALEGLGFVRAIDFEAILIGVPRVGTGFARLFFHPEHHCLAEVNQVFPHGLPTPAMRCMIASILSDGWDLSTTDRVLQPLSYAWRRPRNLWSSYPHETPAKLLSLHLGRRQKMLDRLGITVKTGLTVDGYFAYEQHIQAERKTVLQIKSMATIKAEMEQQERAPLNEWLGDFQVSAGTST